jgi:hypothetical protein
MIFRCPYNYDAHAAVQGNCRFAAGGGATEERKFFPFFGIILLTAPPD